MRPDFTQAWNELHEEPSNTSLRRELESLRPIFNAAMLMDGPHADCFNMQFDDWGDEEHEKFEMLAQAIRRWKGEGL
jgi:hypothetical protein